MTNLKLFFAFIPDTGRHNCANEKRISWLPQHTCTEINPWQVESLKNAVGEANRATRRRSVLASRWNNLPWKLRLSLLRLTRGIDVKRGRRVQKQFVFAGIRRDGRQDASRISKVEDCRCSRWIPADRQTRIRILSCQDVCQCLPAMYSLVLQILLRYFRSNLNI